MGGGEGEGDHRGTTMQRHEVPQDARETSLQRGTKTYNGHNGRMDLGWKAPAFIPPLRLRKDYVEWDARCFSLFPGARLRCIGERSGTRLLRRTWEIGLSGI